MPVLRLENVSMAFGHVALLDKVEWQLDAGERVGLIGRNGGGKSTLLKLLARQAVPDDGRVWQSPDVRLGYVAQEPQLNPEHTVFAAVAEGLGTLQHVLLQYHALSQQLAEAPSNASLLAQLQVLQHQLEAADGWRVQARVEQTVSRLQLPADARVSTLSGGQKKRLALAQALVGAPDILLLDEPTNHLDIPSIEWLEQLLREFPGSVVFITHDRRFLDHVATRIVELDRGLLSEFSGNFAAYQQRKAELLAIEAQQNAKFDKFHAQEEVWIRKGIEARRTRNEGRVRRLEQLRRERTARRERQGTVQFAVDAGEKSGKLVAELVDVCKVFGEKVILQQFSTRILRGDKIGLIGANGVGKSTLLKLILGEMKPDSGVVRQGSKLNVAYFDQLREQLNEELSLAETISQGSDFIEIGGEKKHVISYLEDFLFAPARARSPVKSLSGGERNRLLLARLFTRPANVLVLDEPTNDLDIETLDLLEDVLAQYTGTVFLVSHDRSFLDNVVTQSLVFEGQGIVREYAGGYEDYQRALARQVPPPTTVKQAAEKSKSSSPSALRTKPSNTSKRKLSWKETRELEALPTQIATLEAEQTEIHQALAQPHWYKTDPAQVKIWQARLEEIEENLLEHLIRWEALEQLAAQAQV